MGDLLIEQCPSLRWEFYVWGKRSVFYQQTVLMGYREIGDPKFAIELEGLINAHGLRATDGPQEGPVEFVKMMEKSRFLA
jgi:hypothetical protein